MLARRRRRSRRGSWLAVREAAPRARRSRRSRVSVVLAPSRRGSRRAPAPSRGADPTGLRVTFLDVGQGDAVLLETPRARSWSTKAHRRESPRSSEHGNPLAHGARADASAARPRRRSGGRHPPTRRGPGARPRPRGDRARERRWRSPRREPTTSRPRRPSGHDLPSRRARAARALAGGRRHASEDPNLNAVVLIASYGETDVFLPADAESDVTARLPLRAVEIVKVAHHGSEDPGSQTSSRAPPQVAVISCGGTTTTDIRGPRRSPPRSALRASPSTEPTRTAAWSSSPTERRRDGRAPRGRSRHRRRSPTSRSICITGSDRPKVDTAIARLRGHFEAESIETVSALDTRATRRRALQRGKPVRRRAARRRHRRRRREAGRRSAQGGLEGRRRRGGHRLPRRALPPPPSSRSSPTS